MTSQPYRLIALDLDGTTLDPEGGIRPSTKAALRNALDRDVEVVLVTGRHHVATAPFHRELALTTSTICCNGAYVYDFAERRAIVGDPMSKSQARQLLEIGRRHGAHSLVYTGEAMNFEVEDPHITRFKAWADGFIPSLRPELRRVDSFDRLISEASVIWKFVVSLEDPTMLSAWEADVEAAGEFTSDNFAVHRFDVVRIGNSKGRRLIEWAAARGIAPSEIIAFGDNHNDLSMIRAVGLGVAMGNAEEALKAEAAWVTAANDADGIADALARFLT